MRKQLLVLAWFLSFLLTPLASLSQTYSVAFVPNPKETHGGFVSDPDQILSSETRSAIESIAQEIEDSTSVQVAFAVLGSIGDAVPKDFATELFQQWQIGQKGIDNGLLVLLVMDQRRVEFETGYGLESILPDARCYEIQQEKMVPYFKQGDYAKGLLEASMELREVFFSNEPFTPAPEVAESPNNFWGAFLLIYLVVVAIAFLIFAIVFYIALQIKDLHRRYHFMNVYVMSVWPIVFPLPFIFVRKFVKRSRQQWRDAPRFSPTNGLPMRKLSETEDDRYLQKGQVVEENIKSVDYDVWLSDEDGEIIVLAYKEIFSKYDTCLECGFRTFYLEQTRVIRSATTSSSGLSEKTYRCKNCKSVKVVQMVIPRIQTSSSGGGGSSSSSGGGSFGGGSSGGGGSGSTW